MSTAQRVESYTGTTSSADEDIMTAMKTHVGLSTNPDEVSFTLNWFKLQCEADTKYKINNADNYSQLRRDLVDGLYKLESDQQRVQNLQIEDTGITYHIDFSW